MSVEYEYIGQSQFYKDNFNVNDYRGRFFLTYYLEDDFFVSVVSKDKAKELIDILTKYVAKDGE